MKKFAIFILLLSFGCDSNKNNVTEIPEIRTKSEDLSQNAKQDSEAKEMPQQYEFETENIVDERKIGRRRFSRVRIFAEKSGDKIPVNVEFSTRTKTGWKITDQYIIEKLGELPLEVKIKDYNGDGFNDLSFVSDIAARGANELRDVFLYDVRRDGLRHIENSAEFPNLEYNPFLKCFDSWHFTSITTTVFERLEGNRLVEIASIEESEKVLYVDVRGTKTQKPTSRTLKKKFAGVNRYKSFDPPIPY